MQNINRFISPPLFESSLANVFCKQGFWWANNCSYPALRHWTVQFRQTNSLMSMQSWWMFALSTSFSSMVLTDEPCDNWLEVNTMRIWPVKCKLFFSSKVSIYTTTLSATWSGVHLVVDLQQFVYKFVRTTRMMHCHALHAISLASLQPSSAQDVFNYYLEV